MSRLMLLGSVLLLGIRHASGLQAPFWSCSTRREAIAAVSAVISASALPTLPGALAKLPLGAEEQDRLDLLSRTAPDQLPARRLPSGVIVYDMYEGTGRLAEKGERVYVHFKVWPKNFRSGVPADSSFQDTRPYDWLLGQPDERMRTGFDEGVQGMREDGWRRIVVPAESAYGAAGKVKPGGRGIYLVKPNETAFVDVLMMDAGSGKCASILRPEGVTERGAQNLKSLSCVRGAP